MTPQQKPRASRDALLELIGRLEKAEEGVARIIDPSSWRVFDGYLADMKRKYGHLNAAYDPESFRDKRSLAKAREIIAFLATSVQAEEGK
jgi:hypothetical protein